jgi:RepB DNA-primase from phage plasmid
MDKQSAPKYIRANFRSDDRLAVVLIQKSSGSVIQRLSSSDQIASDDFQRWLRYMNREKHEVYVSMNALHSGARGRTKADVDEVRHVYLDFDVKGDEAVQALRSREDLPTPNHLIESSPGKWQVVWRVEGFDKDQAEALMRGMVQELGADPAATDSSRVLRVPGFYNHKYSTPHFVRVQNLTDEVYHPSRFPDYPDDRRSARMAHVSGVGQSRAAEVGVTQSERDWAYANRALARGDDPEEVIRAIEEYRSDKSNPGYYARHTVEKALQSAARTSTTQLVEAGGDPER